MHLISGRLLTSCSARKERKLIVALQNMLSLLKKYSLYFFVDVTDILSSVDSAEGTRSFTIGSSACGYGRRQTEAKPHSSRRARCKRDRCVIRRCRSGYITVAVLAFCRQWGVGSGYVDTLMNALRSRVKNPSPLRLILGALLHLCAVSVVTIT